MPVVNYERDVLPFDADMENFGSTWTDAQIANIIEGETLAPITTGSARMHLPQADWWVQTQTDWTGSFQSYRDEPGTDPVIVTFLDDLWSVVFGVQGSDNVGTQLLYNRRGQLRPIGKQYANTWKQFFTWARTATPALVEDDITDFYSYGNGLKYGGEEVLPAEVQAARDAYNAETGLASSKELLDAEYRRLYNLNIAPIASSQDPAEVTDQAMKDALQQMSVSWVDQLS